MMQKAICHNRDHDGTTKKKRVWKRFGVATI